MNIKNTLFVMVFLLVSACASANNSSVCFDTECFDVEIMQTDVQLKKGMQGRTSLVPTKGMLFVFKNDGRHSFWMKDTLIPLDMIWLDSDYRVVGLQSDAKPCVEDPCRVYAPAREARYVLELQAGMINALNIDQNDQAKFKLNKTVE